MAIHHLALDIILFVAGEECVFLPSCIVYSTRSIQKFRNSHDMELIACWIFGFLALSLPILDGFEEKTHGYEAIDLLTGGNVLGGKVMLRSSDEKLFEVDEAIAYESQTLKDMIQEAGMDASPIPVAHVSSKILAKVIQYSKYHVEAQKSGEDKAIVEERIKAWDADFVKVDSDTLFNLVLAAHHLNISSLMDLTCQTVADMVKGKTPEEIRILFNTTSNYTSEEQEKELVEEEEEAEEAMVEANGRGFE